MTLLESLHNKLKTAPDLAQRINSWDIYGEKTVLVFCEDISIDAPTLEKLWDYRALGDFLILALPEDYDDKKLFVLTNLQVVDALVLYDKPLNLLREINAHNIAFEGMEVPELSESERARLISL